MADDHTNTLSSATTTTVLPRSALLVQMMTGYWVSQSIYIAAKLRVADLLADGAQTVELLATTTQTHAPSLQRLLRVLASIGIFTEASHNTFVLTPLAMLLRSGTPNSMAALAILYAEEQYRAWGNVLHSVRTGETAFEQQFGMSYLAYLAQHPDADRVFNAAMTGWTMQRVGAVVDTYDFSPFKRLVDVGGSYGTLLAAILQSNQSKTRHCPGYEPDADTTDLLPYIQRYSPK